MIEFKSGIFDVSRLISNILMLVLLAGNIFFSVQYITNIQNQNTTVTDNTAEHIKRAHFLDDYINIVLNTKGAISQDDRVKLEDEVIQLHDAAISTQWAAFVASPDPQSAQDNAVKLMAMLSAKLV